MATNVRGYNKEKCPIRRPMHYKVNKDVDDKHAITNAVTLWRQLGRQESAWPGSWLRALWSGVIQEWFRSTKRKNGALTCETFWSRRSKFKALRPKERLSLLECQKEGSRGLVPGMQGGQAAWKWGGRTQNQWRQLCTPRRELWGSLWGR